MQKISLPLSERTLTLEYYSGGEGQKPAVIFFHDIMGIVPALRKTAEALSKIGVHVFLPDLYTDGGAKYCIRSLFSSVFRNNEPDNNPFLDEVHEIITAINQREDVESNNLGIVGQCLTGGFVLHAAIRDEVKAPIIFHHSFGWKGSGIPSSCSAQIEKQLQGHFCNIDPMCPDTRVKKLKEEIGLQLEDYWYNLPHGIPHFFFNTDQGRDAFERMLAFIKLNLLQEIE
ncbi:MAG: dienelactone hydrolase family protein [Chitinophagales bacterium]|nr:dienelactone hydrolase family protein [Chitinophagales bacterium]